MRIRVEPLVAVALLVSGLATAQTAQTNPARSRAMPRSNSGSKTFAPSDGTRRRSRFSVPSRSIRGSRWPTTRSAAPPCRRKSMPRRPPRSRDAAICPAEQAGKQFSNQQEAQQYRRDQLKEIDEVIRQYQSGPQTAQTSGVRSPVDRAAPHDAGEPAARHRRVD